MVDPFAATMLTPYDQVPFSVKTLIRTGVIPVNPKRSTLRPRSRVVGRQFELNVYKGLCTYVKQHDDGYPIPIHQARFGNQVIDILADNIDGEFVGIECKFTGKFTTRISTLFYTRQVTDRRTGKKYAQSEFGRQTYFLERAGRVGILALMMPAMYDTDVTLNTYLIPWSVATTFVGSTITTTMLDAAAVSGLVEKLPTEDGTVDIPHNTFMKLARVHYDLLTAQ